MRNKGGTAIVPHARKTSSLRISGVVFALAALVLGACGSSKSSKSASSNTTAASNKSPYELAVDTDLSGPFSAPAGIPLSEGFQAYIESINAKGGVNGHKINVTLYDDRSDVQTAVANYQKIVDSKAIGLVGVTASAVWAVLGPKAEGDGLLQTGIGGDQFVLTPYKWVFKIQMLGGDIGRNQVKFASKLATDKNIATPTVSIIAYDSPGNRQWVDAVTKEVQSKNWKLAETQYVPTSTTDFSGVAAKVAAAKSDFVLTVVLEAQLPGFVTAMRGHGVKAPIINGVTNISDKVLTSIADSDLYLARDVASVADTSNPGVQEMMQVAKSTGHEKGIEGPAYIQAYVHAKVVVEALKACGDNCTRATFRDKLETAKSNSNGLTGPPGYVPDKHVMLNQPTIVHLDTSVGHAVPVKGFEFPS